MQPFFIATRHFSVQNKVMQDQEPEKQKKINTKEIIWGSIAIILLLVGCGIFWNTVKKLPHAEWRNEYTPLSWEACGVCIDKADAFWKASAGDARMELRSYCFPVFRMELDEAEGSGHVTVRFKNGQGIQMGDRIYLPYKDGKFTPRQNNSVQVTETEVTVRLEDGFLSEEEYVLHQFDEHAPLWKVEVECRPEGGEAVRLGYLSILPNDL